MSKKIKYSNEPISAEIIRDFPPALAELLREVQRRSAEFDAGRMKSTPAEEVFKRTRARFKK